MAWIDNSIISKKVTIIDWLAVVQSVGKLQGSKSWSGKWLWENNISFTSTIQGQAPSEGCVGEAYPTAYHVTDTSSSVNVNAKQFLADTQRKDELTLYLAQKCLQHFRNSSMIFITTSKYDASSNGKKICSTYIVPNKRLILRWFLCNICKC